VVGLYAAGLHRGVGPKHKEREGARHQGSVGCTSTALTRSDRWKKVRCKGAGCHSFGCVTPLGSDLHPRLHIQWPSCNNNLPRPGVPQRPDGAAAHGTHRHQVINATLSGTSATTLIDRTLGDRGSGSGLPGAKLQGTVPDAHHRDALPTKVLNKLWVLLGLFGKSIAGKLRKLMA